jgi:AbrB family looped-hinge helix DNA binding protein
MAEKTNIPKAAKTNAPFILQCNKRGQIIIPKEIRQSLGSIEGEFDIFSAGKDIFLKKVKSSRQT